MDFDTRTLTLIESVRRLARENYCPADLPEIAMTSHMDSIEERYHALKERQWTTNLSDDEMEIIHAELCRIAEFRPILRELKKEYSVWEAMDAFGVTEKIQKENTLFVLHDLQTILANALNGWPLAEGVRKNLLWLLENTLPQPSSPETSDERPSVEVSTSLFVGKALPAARDALNGAGLADCVVACVLKTSCGATKTEIGCLLLRMQSDSSEADQKRCLRHANKLLEKAADLNIRLI